MAATSIKAHQSPPREPRNRRGRWLIVALIVMTIVALAAVLFTGPVLLLLRGDRVDIGGGRNMYVLCQGSGSPTVILEHGLGANGTDWDRVQNEVDDVTRVCFRSRAGLGFSDSIPDNSVQTAQDAADDLEALLVAADIDGPYVVRLFADQHPDEVLGMVLVDSSHPDQPALVRDRLSAQAWADVSSFFEGSDNPEDMDLAASAAEVTNTDDLADLPLIVLQADQQRTDADAANISQASADELDAAMDQLWPELQQELAALSTSGRLVRAEGSGHFIHVDKPDLVIDAITSVLGQAGRTTD